MARFVRLALCLVIALTVPVQGMASIAMSACVGGHGHAPAVASMDHAAMGHGHDAAHHFESGMDTGNEHHPPDADEHSAHNCGACSACCSLPVAPAAPALMASHSPVPSLAIPFFEAIPATQSADPIEKPPSSTLLA